MLTSRSISGTIPDQPLRELMWTWPKDAQEKTSLLSSFRRTISGFDFAFTSGYFALTPILYSQTPHSSSSYCQVSNSLRADLGQPCRRIGGGVEEG